MTQQRTDKPVFSPGRRRTVQLSEQELVAVHPLHPGEALPLVVSPNVEHVNLVSWAAAHREWIDRQLTAAGGLLFRGFGVDTVERFQDFVAATSEGPLPYRERSSPRSQVSGSIYTSTDHPPDQEIFLHNEQSYNLVFPRKIYFFCVRAARQGGATPIADCRRVLARLAPATVQRFAAGYQYVRNFGDGLGLPWQTAFQTGDRSEVERYCRDNGIELDWKEGGRLRTRQVRGALARHPGSGELTWFNHATFFHPSTLPAAVQTALGGLAPDDLPNNTCLDDGSPIPAALLQELHAAYGAEKRRFDWQPGDVLLLDNMLAAHGREPFEGERKVVVAMADPTAWESVRPASLPTKPARS
ncbi:MAG TPA: TauD/TfdA family dioxygenase [Thermoanaerobaculia bacterium]|nr:TauD/TfdA family dioxygenase [Thermoanaerobaculia bacterium]